RLRRARSRASRSARALAAGRGGAARGVRAGATRTAGRGAGPRSAGVAAAPWNPVPVLRKAARHPAPRGPDPPGRRGHPAQTTVDAQGAATPGTVIGRVTAGV